VDIQASNHRVQRIIHECRALGIEPDARTVAEIMVDDDVTRERYGDFSIEWHAAFTKYRNAAARILGRLSESSSTASTRRRA
jgi:hypothetical protein